MGAGGMGIPGQVAFFAVCFMAAPVSAQSGAAEDGQASADDTAPEDGQATTDEKAPEDGQAATDEKAPADGQASGDEQGSERARLKFEEGRRAYQQGDYEQAIEAWKAAYELDPRPRLLYNLSQAHERYGKLQEAVAHLERYLEESPPDDPNRDRAHARLSSLRERLEHTGIRIAGAPEGAEIRVDGESRGRAPRPDPIPVDPGSHRVAVAHEGYETFRSQVVVTAGEQLEVTTDMRPGDTGATGATAPRRNWGPYVLGGAGAALVVGAAVVGGVALSKAKSAESQNDGDADTADTLAPVADALGVIGGAAVAGGLIWWLVTRHSREEQAPSRDAASVSVVPVFGARGGGAEATVRF